MINDKMPGGTQIGHCPPPSMHDVIRYTYLKGFLCRKSTLTTLLMSSYVITALIKLIDKLDCKYTSECNMSVVVVMYTT